MALCGKIRVFFCTRMTWIMRTKCKDFSRQMFSFFNVMKKKRQFRNFHFGFGQLLTKMRCWQSNHRKTLGFPKFGQGISVVAQSANWNLELMPTALAINAFPKGVKLWSTSFGWNYKYKFFVRMAKV